jgi:hypothetical protein
MADAFFSYAREDTEIVRRIHAAMEADETDVWVDWEGIPPTAEWMKEIYSAIEAADYFVFAVSPHSATSKVCGLEIDCALPFATTSGLCRCLYGTWGMRRYIRKSRS